MGMGIWYRVLTGMEIGSISQDIVSYGNGVLRGIACLVLKGMGVGYKTDSGLHMIIIIYPSLVCGLSCLCHMFHWYKPRKEKKCKMRGYSKRAQHVITTTVRSI